MDRLFYRFGKAPVGKVDIADLFTFSDKISGKATWTRDIFISNSCFTSDGFEAFGHEANEPNLYG